MQVVRDTTVSNPGINQEHGSQDSSAHVVPEQYEVNDSPLGKEA